MKDKLIKLNSEVKSLTSLNPYSLSVREYDELIKLQKQINIIVTKVNKVIFKR